MQRNSNRLYLELKELNIIIKYNNRGLLITLFQMFRILTESGFEK